MMRAPVLGTLAWVTALALLSGCEAQRRASQNQAIQKEAAQEIKRICALPPAAREAELERISKESGIVVQCGKQTKY